MKTVKSVADLKQLALARGARVELGNTRFNTTGERVTGFPKREMPAAAEPAPKPEPREPAAPPPPAEVRVDLAPVAEAQLKMGEMLARALASQPTPQAPVREWLFTVERDDSGLLTTIRATAQT